MRARFYIDPATGMPHIHGHDVVEEEVIDVLERPGEDRNGREGSRVALGQTASGRYLRVVYVPGEDGDSVFVITAYELTGKPLAAFPHTQEEEAAAMSDTNLPEGWDESRLRRVLAHYEEQTGDDAVLEDEAEVRPSETVMTIPHELVPQVRELIAKHHQR